MKRMPPIFTAILLLYLVSPAAADWNPDDPAKRVQMPDMELAGIDVNTTVPFILAEQSPTGYSMPGSLHWFYTVQPGSYEARIWADNLEEGWLKPPIACEFPGDTICWQYYFLIPPQLAFYQEGSPDSTAGDQVLAGMPLLAGVNSLSFPVPGTGVAAHFAVARFRFSLAGGLTVTGFAPDGEVKDHRVFAHDNPTDVPCVVPQSFKLHQSTPNPFNPRTTIRFDLPSEEQVELTIFTIDGRRIAALVDRVMIAGSHEVIWNGQDDGGQPVASGTYFYRVEAGPYRQTERMVLIK